MAPPPPRALLSTPCAVREKENKAFLSAGEREKKSRSFPADPRLWSPVSHPPASPLLRGPRGAGPSHLYTFWKGGKQDCHLSTFVAGIPTFPLRNTQNAWPRHRCGRDTAARRTLTLTTAGAKGSRA